MMQRKVLSFLPSYKFHLFDLVFPNTLLKSWTESLHVESEKSWFKVILFFPDSDCRVNLGALHPK